MAKYMVLTVLQIDNIMGRRVNLNIKLENKAWLCKYRSKIVDLFSKETFYYKILFVSVILQYKKIVDARKQLQI